MDAVRNTLTLMHSCGMYDSAGEFSFGVRHFMNIHLIMLAHCIHVTLFRLDCRPNQVYLV